MSATMPPPVGGYVRLAVLGCAVRGELAKMAPEPNSLLGLRRKDWADSAWLVNLVMPKIGGGRLDESHLAAIGENPSARALRISGLDQATFERLVARYGPQFSAIEFWKCPRIADLSPLEDLPDLQLVAFYWNQCATRLWNLSRNPRLTGLCFEDFTRLHDLRDLEAGIALKELQFGDAVWSTSVFESLGPLAALGGLRSLNFNAKRIGDGRIEPLGGLTRLQALRFPPRQFTTRQVAWLRARLPTSLESAALTPVVQFERPFKLDGKDKDVLLVGKRKPFLNSVTDEVRIRKHVNEFWQMVGDFQRDPTLKPD
jgi:hypothetical protein